MVTAVYILLYIVGAFTTMAVAHKLKETEDHDDIGIMGLMWPVLIAIALLFGIVHLVSYLSILVKKIVK